MDTRGQQLRQRRRNGGGHGAGRAHQPFGGAWLELVDADGAVVDQRPAVEGRAGIVQLTVLEDDRVLASGSLEAGGFYLELLSLPG